MTRKLRSEPKKPRPSAKLTELPSAAAHHEAAQYEDDNVGVEAANRTTQAAEGGVVMEFGLRRAQGPDAGIYGARAAIIGGCHGTSNVLTGKMYDVPIMGTHAHSWVMSFPTELEAFRKYAELFPSSCLLLVDTYDTLHSGVPNAITVFRELRERGYEPKGIRLDSGDLAYLTREARKMLDEAGWTDCKISVSNSLDE